jgi:hypothetical protein
MFRTEAEEEIKGIPLRMMGRTDVLTVYPSILRKLCMIKLSYQIYLLSEEKKG